MEFNTLFTGKNFIELERVDSTNNYAANMLIQTNVPDGTVILAHFQENGRGQMGNEWQSSPGQNIMTSVIYHFKNLDPDRSFLLSKAISLAIYETVNEVVKQNVSIKWPNDIYVEDQKISGMLIENKWQGQECSSIIGIGLNVNQRFFGNLEATSLANCTGLSFELERILNLLLSRLEKFVSIYRNGNYKELSDSYLSYLRYFEEPKEFTTNTNEVFSGKITDVEDSGHMVIQLNDGNVRKFMFKQVFVNSELKSKLRNG